MVLREVLVFRFFDNARDTASQRGFGNNHSNSMERPLAVKNHTAGVME